MEITLKDITMKTRKILLLLLVITLIACGKSTKSIPQESTADTINLKKPAWLLELEQRNPLRNKTDNISVYFRYDTIINGYEIKGIFFPSYLKEHGWSNECGVIMYFKDTTTGKEYELTDFEEDYKVSRNIFMSKNVCDIIGNHDFTGFKDGDWFDFHYDNSTDPSTNSPLYLNAEFQFYDIDFDGKDELLIGYYHGGQYGCTMFEACELTDSVLVRRAIVIDEYSQINRTNRTITYIYRQGCYAPTKTVYKFNKKGDIIYKKDF